MNTNPGAVAISGLSGHLTEAQFGELLAGPAKKADRPLTPAEHHVLTCEQCAAELASLRETLALFRGATTAYADDQLRNSAPIPVPARLFVSPALRPMYFAIAATLALAAFLPMQTLHQRSRQAVVHQAAAATAVAGFQHYARESNEALLEDVDRAASASVPDSMQALADPMGNNDLSARKSSQRKD